MRAIEYTHYTLLPQILIATILGVKTLPFSVSREFKLLPQDADLSRDPGPVSDLILQLQISTDKVLQRASQTGEICMYTITSVHI